MSGRRYESFEPGTRLWLSGLGFEGYSAVFAAEVWRRVQDGATVGAAVDEELCARREKIAGLMPQDPFEGL